MSKNLTPSEKPKISFLVAAYNVAPYLEECMNSILQYPGNDIEAIIVDDGSTDATGELSDAIALRDPRVQVIHQENGRLPAARNTGIRAARGEWLTFIDADDRLSKGAVPAMLDSCDFDGDLMVFGCVSFRDDQEVYHWRPRAYTLSAPDELRAYRSDSMMDKRAEELYGNPNIATSWGKLFRTSFIRGHSLYFEPRVSFSQDREHLFRYTRFLTKIQFVPAQVYEYRLANESSLTNKWHPDALEKQTEIMNAMMRTMVDYHEENDREIRKIYHYVGLFAISTRCVMQGVCHPQCTWSLIKRRNNLKKLRQSPWAAESLAALSDFDGEKMPWRSVLKCLRLRLYAPVLFLRFARRLKRRVRAS